MVSTEGREVTHMAQQPILPGQLPPGLPVLFDDQLPDRVLNPDGTYKNPNANHVFLPDPPQSNGMGGTVLTTKQCGALVPKVIG